jgi:hypothetical protein
MDTRVTWQGRSWHLPCENEWSYIRYGTTPVDGSGDYDSDGEVNDTDFYFFADYFSGADTPALPGGRWADFDADGDVDCDDWDAFRGAWTGGGDPPPFVPCAVGSIPTLSEWGLVAMTLLTLTAGTLVFTRRRDGLISFAERA